MTLGLKDTRNARWRPLYDTMRTADYGRMFSYYEMNSIVGHDVRGDSRWVVYSVDKALQTSDNRALAVVRGQGYRIVEPAEHLGLAHKHRLRGKRQTRKASRVAEATDLSRIADPEVRAQIQEMSRRMRDVEMRLNHQDRRVQQVKTDLESETSERRTQDRALTERLDRIERMLGRG